MGAGNCKAMIAIGSSRLTSSTASARQTANGDESLQERERPAVMTQRSGQEEFAALPRINTLCSVSKREDGIMSEPTTPASASRTPSSASTRRKSDISIDGHLLRTRKTATLLKNLDMQRLPSADDLLSLSPTRTRSSSLSHSHLDNHFKHHHPTRASSPSHLSPPPASPRRGSTGTTTLHESTSTLTLRAPRTSEGTNAEKRVHVETGGSESERGSKGSGSGGVAMNVAAAHFLPPQAIRNELLLQRIAELQDTAQTARVVALPRGGTYVRTTAGAVQFGVPPETIKDSMLLGLPPPAFYVIPKQSFIRAIGINVAEFEFPAYYNFFVKRQKVNIVTTPEKSLMVRTVLQETLFGPLEFPPEEDFAREFAAHVARDARPDLEKELGYFRKNPFDPTQLMQVETVMAFTLLSDDGVAVLGGEEDSGARVSIHAEEDDMWSVREDGVEIARVCDAVDLLPPIIAPVVNNTHNHSHALKDFMCPNFGVTFLGSSHGFDPTGTTNGFVIWLNGRGVMVDPPPYSSALLRAEGIPARLIDTIELTHCHADHDAGTFQKILEEARVMVMTTPTIMDSFMRKYACLTGLSQDLLRRLFLFQPVTIDEPLKLHGGELRFFYSLHAIPCIGIKVYCGGKSLVFSGDTCYDPVRIREMEAAGVLGKGRAAQLAAFPAEHDLILHEQGVPPLHTSVAVLAALPDDVKKRLYCVHVSAKGFPFHTGLKVAACGVEHTIRLETTQTSSHVAAVGVLDLISSLDIFRDMPISKARDVLQMATTERFTPGNIIVREGTPGDKFYIIQKGTVRVHNKSNAMMFSCGDYFGELAILTGKPRMARATAVTDVTVLVFDKFSFLGLIRGTDTDTKLLEFQHTRLDKSWEVLMENTVMARSTVSQKLQMQRILELRDIPAGCVLWRKGEKASIAAVVSQGMLAYEGQTLEGLKRGAFVCDMDALMEGREHETTVVAKEDSELYVVQSHNLKTFFVYNPGLQLAFMNTFFLE